LTTASYEDQADPGAVVDGLSKATVATHVCLSAKCERTGRPCALIAPSHDDCESGGIMHKRRLIGVVGLAMAAIVTFPTSAGAFECYNAIRSAQGNQSAAQSKTLMSISEILADPEIVGLCPDGVEFVIDGLQEAGFRTDVLINFRTLMASGLEKTHPERMQDGKGVDHLSEEFFATAGPLVDEAFSLC
jgi:hypothetical protein